MKCPQCTKDLRNGIIRGYYECDDCKIIWYISVSATYPKRD